MSNFLRFSLFTFDALSNIFLIMATNSSKQRRIDKSYKIKYKALKELEKGTPHKDVARMFEVPTNTLSRWITVYQTLTYLDNIISYHYVEICCRICYAFCNRLSGPWQIFNIHKILCCVKCPRARLRKKGAKVTITLPFCPHILTHWLFHSLIHFHLPTHWSTYFPNSLHVNLFTQILLTKSIVITANWKMK